MANITLAIPDDLHAQMRLVPEVRWSNLFRDLVRQRMREELMRNEIELRKWSVDLSRKSKKGRFKELKKKGLI